MSDLLPPPEPFTLPVIICPACSHGIDPHSVDPGQACGVGSYDEESGVTTSCLCLLSPNDIAAVLIADERERIAQALLAEWDNPSNVGPHDWNLGYRTGVLVAAKIARQGTADD